MKEGSRCCSWSECRTWHAACEQNWHMHHDFWYPVRSWARYPCSDPPSTRSSCRVLWQQKKCSKSSQPRSARKAWI